MFIYSQSNQLNSSHWQRRNTTTNSRYGCQADQRASAPDPRTQPANDAPTTEQDGAEAPAAGTGGGLHGFRVWLDRMNVWEVAPGVWAARYVELHQPFTAGEHVEALVGRSEASAS